MTKTRPKLMVVWVGYCNDKPHIYHDFRVMRKGQAMLAVYTTRRAARQDYEDVRKMCLEPTR